MATITTAGVTGGSITIGLGGFGGDNFKGTVTDSTGLIISGARVSFVRTDGTAQGVGPTNNSGKYNLDTDASVGDTYRVDVTWVDGAGGRHRIVGTFTVTTADVLMAEDPKKGSNKGQKS